MIIAIASSGNTPESKIDKHFARCSYFAMFDTEADDLYFEKNICRTLESNVGLAVAECLNEKKVKKIISGEFGIKVKAVLDRHGIQMIVITDHDKTIKEIIDLLKSKMTESKNI
jgi:predicted Fe-Mo cluster-binding NifX family protein